MTDASPHLPLIVVVCASVVLGLVTVLAFHYLSDRVKLHRAKELLGAHLLALRLFQDQIPVVVRSYGLIVLATAQYLKVVLRPVLITALPLVLLFSQMDRYLGSLPLQAGENFLVKAKMANPDAVGTASLQLPQGLRASAPPVHIPAEDVVVWRVQAQHDGKYEVNVQLPAASFAKRVVVSRRLARLSPIRLRGRWWERILVSAEPSLPMNAGVSSIAVEYPPRTIAFAGIAWNWIWLLLLLSLAAGLVFKTALGIEI
jgi:uncharacterized membrane protein (DUF106 family)